MQNIQLYYMPISPVCRSVEMVAGMVGAQLDKHVVNLMAGEHLREDYVRLNPLHKVPFMVDGEFKLGESRAIMMYLVNKFKPGDGLYPAEAKRRAAIDELLFYDNGTLFPAQFKLFKPIIFGGAEKPEPEDEKALRDCLQYLDARLGSSNFKFMTGNQLTIADISLVVGFDHFATARRDLVEFKRLVAYSHRVRQAVPNYAEINAGPIEQLKQFIASKQATRKPQAGQ